MKSGLIKIIDGYENTRLGKRFLSFSYSGSVSSKNKKSKTLMLHKLGERISSFFAATRSTCYGAFFVSFGLAVLLFYFFNDFTGAYEGRNIVTLTLGIVCSLISIPLLLVDKPSHRMVSESRLLDYVFFEFFCMKRAWSPEEKRGAPTLVGVIFGVLLATLGILIPVGNLALAVGALVIVYLSFSSPEFPYLLSLLMIPYSAYLPYATLISSLLVTLSFVSFFRKAVSGKRVVNIEQYDAVILIILTLVCIYAAFNREGTQFADYLVIISLFMGYTLASNIIINRRLADSISNVLVVATLPIALYVDVSRVISFIAEGPVADASPALALSVVASAILSIRLVKHASGFVKAVYALVMSLHILSVGLMLSPVYAIALAVGMLTTVLYRAGKYFSFLIAPVCFALALSHLLPASIKAPIYAFLSIDGATLVERLFSTVTGVVIFVLVILLFLIRIRHRIVYSVFFEGTHLTGISVGYAGAIVALMLILSSFPDMLSNFTLYLLLSVFGMGSAALRIAKSESDNAELYFEYSKSIDSSTLNIVIH